ncbi:hypothetical protein FKW77_003802 [Venturia effusa]|uniref:Heterokaryon incompatibility domain-containing protein n=1 Tax=Venturia effusa TaxID=50376 RepID=A0A517LGX4_9PEZI|nr:hypothetical protein FKW77_003802 [Venturia effusa]
MPFPHIFNRKIATEKQNENVAHLVYRPLIHDDAIRVLTIKPGTSQAPIKCRLENHRLGDNLSYEALSYVWGPESPAYKIKVNKRHFVVRENLYHALHQLRSMTEARSIWVDAICLDQNNTQERNDQVQRMTRIYTSARRTIVWLGQPQPMTEAALLFLLEAEKTKQRSNKDTDVMEWIAAKLRDDDLGQIHEALSNFFSNTWFSRVWIQQEFAVSSDVIFVYGRFEIASETIQSAISAVHSIIDNVYGLYNNTDQAWKLFHLRKEHRDNLPKSSLPLLLYYNFGRLEASDPRDHIFSLLGLVDVDEGKLVKVDYDASVENVFITTMTHCLEHYPKSTFRLLSLVGYCPQGKYRKALPSWVPDFSSTSVLTRGFSNITFFAASGGLESDIAITSWSLTLRGRIVDTITTCLHDPSPGLKTISGSDSRKWHLQCRNSGERAGMFYSKTDFEEVWWRLLVCDMGIMLAQSQTLSTAQEVFGAYYLDQEMLHQDFISNSKSKRNDSEFLEMQSLYNRTRRSTSAGLSFCSTSKGLLGWIPRTANEGDKICIFDGARAPFLIRERGDGTYELIGEAYIHGIMYGEAMKWEDITSQTITIT